MPPLWMFACLSLTAAAAALMTRTRLQASRRFGIGGPDEDLERARRLYRAAFLWSSAFVVTSVLASILAFRGATAWRQTFEGTTVLSILVFIGVAGFVNTAAKAVYEEWSANGSTLGMLRETGIGFLAGAFLMLTLYWRFGT